MNHYYILIGYNKKKDYLKTRTYHTIEEVLDIINWWHKQAGLGDGFTDKKAFEAAVQAEGKHGNVFPIDSNPNVLWNVYYV